MRYKLVFFDFDGTLMDTSEGILSSGRKAMIDCGLEPVFVNDQRTFIGPPLDECFRIAFGVNDREMLNRLCDSYRGFYHSEGRFLAKFYPGIVDVVKTLRNRGYLIGMATLKYVELACEMLDYFGVRDLFDSVTGLDKANKSTKADLLIEGAKDLNVDIRDCVLVGDSDYDRLGAENAGCDFIGVDWGFGFDKNQKGLISEAGQILELV